MKICAILLATVTLAQDDPPAASYKAPLKCWQCDAMSFEECGYEGYEQTCSVGSYNLV